MSADDVVVVDEGEPIPRRAVGKMVRVRPVPRPRTPSLADTMRAFAETMAGRDKRADEMTDAELDQWRRLSQRRARRLRVEQDRRLNRRDEAVAIVIVVVAGLLAMSPLFWAGVR